MSSLAALERKIRRLASPKPKASKKTSPKPKASKPKASKKTSPKPKASKPKASKKTSPKPKASKPKASKKTSPRRRASKPKASKKTSPRPRASKPKASKKAPKKAARPPREPRVDPALRARRETARELRRERSEITAKKKELTTQKRGECQAERTSARTVCRSARDACGAARAKARGACSVDGGELSELRRLEVAARDRLAAIRAQDPATYRAQRARERAAERLELEAENLPAELRAPFLTAARRGAIKTTKGAPPQQRWERFLEMAREDPSLTRTRQRGEPYEVQQARHELERADAAGDNERAEELRAFLAAPKRFAALEKQRARAQRMLQRAEQGLSDLRAPLLF